MRKYKWMSWVVAVVLVMSVMLMGCSDQKAKEQAIQDKVTEIETAYEAFTAETDHAKRLEAYKTMRSDDVAYTDEDAAKEKYAAVLADMKKAFTDEYDRTITENTVDVSKEDDEKKVTGYKENLSKCLDTIKADAVCTEEEITAYETQITTATATYDARVTVIKKAAEEKKKAEEEAKAQKESEEAVKTSANSSQSPSNQASSYSASNNSGSSYSANANDADSSYSANASNMNSGSNSASSGLSSTSGSTSDTDASDNSSYTSDSDNSGSSDDSSDSGSSSDSSTHYWAEGWATGDDGEEHYYRIEDGILYGDEGEVEDISDWLAH